MGYKWYDTEKIRKPKAGSLIKIMNTYCKTGEREWGEEERRENCLIINTRKENRNNILSPIDNKITKFRGEKILCVQLLCDISLGPC